MGYRLNITMYRDEFDKNFSKVITLYDTTYRVNNKEYAPTDNNYWQVAAFDSTGVGAFSPLIGTDPYFEK